MPHLSEAERQLAREAADLARLTSGGTHLRYSELMTARSKATIVSMLAAEVAQQREDEG